VVTDPRNTDWFWLRTPEPALLIFVAYLIFVYVGPRLMANRQPLNIRGLIVVYNFAMVVLSTFMCAEVLTFIAVFNNCELRSFTSVCFDCAAAIVINVLGVHDRMSVKARSWLPEDSVTMR